MGGVHFLTKGAHLYNGNSPLSQMDHPRLTGWPTMCLQAQIGNENQTNNTPDPTGDVFDDEGGDNEAAPTGGGGDPGDYDDPDDSDNGEGHGTPGCTPGGDGARQRRGNEFPPPNNLNGVTFERYSKGLDAQKCADSITDMVILSDGVDLKDIYNFSIWREKLVCGILSYVNDKLAEDITAYLELSNLYLY